MQTFVVETYLILLVILM